MVLTRTGLRFGGRLFPCTIGRSGVTLRKREGDGATPAGVHGIIGCLYRPDRMARPVDWALPIGPGSLWSDDPGGPRLQPDGAGAAWLWPRKAAPGGPAV